MVATWAGFEQLSPDSWHPIPILIAEGDYVAVLLPTYGHFTGRSHQAPPPTGGRLGYGMVNMVRFDAGKLAEMWFGMDSLVELQQMGLTPASPPRAYRPTEQANLTAFLEAARRSPPTATPSPCAGTRSSPVPRLRGASHRRPRWWGSTASRATIPR